MPLLPYTGVESVNLFNTTDLFEEKAMFLVINSIIVLANNVKSKPWYTGPIIADTSKVRLSRISLIRWPLCFLRPCTPRSRPPTIGKVSVV